MENDLPKAAASASDAGGSSPHASLAGKALEAVYQTLIALRAPSGCPWDREQTPASLRRHLVEESYELLDAIDEGSNSDIEEELGDVLLLVAMISRCYEEQGVFSFADVVNALNEKLIRRHPHVFADAVAEDSETVIKQWNEIKENVEGKPRKTRHLDSVPRSVPPLERAYGLQKKAAKAGFDWTTSEDVIEKLREEVQEVEEVLRSAEKDTSNELEAEVGDLLFSAVNVSRHLGVDPAIALNRTNRTFYTRFAYVEDEMHRVGVPMSAQEVDRMEAFWQEAKSQYRKRR